MFFGLLLLLALGLVAVVVVGPSLPPDSVFHSFALSVRDTISGMSQGFGGGYRPITPSG